MTIIRSLLAVAALKQWVVHQMDVKNTFLHGDLVEDVYMKLPTGYTHPGFRIPIASEGESSIPSGPPNVCKLLNSLYGLKEAPRQWFSKLSQALLANHFLQSKNDYNLFTKQTADCIIIILVYVDDLLIAGNDSTLIQSTKDFLNTYFHMKDLGPVRYFLSLEVDHTPQGYFLSQRKYILDLLKEYGLTHYRPLRLPTRDPLPNPEPYQRLVGKLIYLTISRPDISFTVHALSKFMHKPTAPHYQAALRVLRYLKGSPHQGVLFASNSTAALTAYCDSDWAGCPSTRKFTTGFCVLLGNSPFSWKSKRQTIVARSSAEAEYRAMAMTTCEVLWVNQLLKDLGVPHLVLLHYSVIIELLLLLQPIR